MQNGVPGDYFARVAIDLGAESCRVSLLRWSGTKPSIEIVHRFANGAIDRNGSLRWNLQSICENLNAGLLKCAEVAREGIGSIAVDGWSVDYARLNGANQAVDEAFCYRDPRTISAEPTVRRQLENAGIDRERQYALTGVEQLRINTVYQLSADPATVADAPWVMLPEYILLWLGGERVAEWTNATHTGLVDPTSGNWSWPVVDAVGLSRNAFPRLVPPGTTVGRVTGELARLPAFRDTILIAGVTHDTAAAIAGIPADGDDWGYISSGTWSLVGTLLDRPCLTPEARAANFTNLGAVGNRFMFHKLVNGMWLLRQSMETWAGQGATWTVPQLVEAAETAVAPPGLIDVADPDLLLPGDVPARINAQRLRSGLNALATGPSSAPVIARLIFESLADKYAQTLRDITRVSGKSIRRLYVVGGGSQNKLLNQLTEKATGVGVLCGAVESSTIGNFAVQLAVAEGEVDTLTGVSRDAVARWASSLQR